MISKSCNYAIRALSYIAARQQKAFISLREISQELNISFHFLSKIHLILIHHQLTNSSRGVHGGISLARNPESISVLDVIKAVDGEEFLGECLLGLENCSESNPCHLHEPWMKYRNNIQNLFKETTLADLARKRKTGEMDKLKAQL